MTNRIAGGMDGCAMEQHLVRLERIVCALEQIAQQLRVLTDKTPLSTPSSSAASSQERLERIETTLNSLIEKKSPKEWYTTEEAAKVLGRAPWTVRQWCRLKRVHAKKRSCGRGLSPEWIISHEEILRIQNEGLLPLQK
jgi:hypothetical protein